MSLAGSFELPYGTLVWASDDSIAACLVPTDQGTPLTQVALLSLGSGAYPIVLEQAVGSDLGFEIYDVRATSSTLVWTEADILDGVWRVYTARHDGGSIGTPASWKRATRTGRCPPLRLWAPTRSGRCCRSSTAKRRPSRRCSSAPPPALPTWKPSGRRTGAWPPRPMPRKTR